MKVLLLKEVKNIGRAGEVKEVAEGYARNYLIPNGIADLVTKHSLSVIAARKNKLARQATKEKAAKARLAKKLDGQEFELIQAADQKGSLYSKVSSRVIAQELEKQGLNLTAGEVVLEEAIRRVGKYRVELKLGGASALIKLTIKAKQ